MSLKLPPEQRAAILALAGRTSIREIARRTGASKTSVARVLADVPDSAPDPAPVDDAPDEVIPEAVPAGTPLETIRRWQANVERWSQIAERDGNIGALAQLTARQTALLEAARRAAEDEKPEVDPNEHPDMKRAAEAYTAKLMALVDRVAEEIAK